MFFKSFSLRRWPTLLLAGLLGLVALSRAAHATDFLPADAAFKLQPRAEQGRVVLGFEIAHGYYLYRERIHVEPLDANVKLGSVDYPKGQIKHDPNFDQDMEVYHDPITVAARFDAQTAAGATVLKVDYQGCAEAGLCYPPQTAYLRVSVAAGGQAQGVDAISADDAQRGASSAVPAASGAASSVASVASVESAAPANENSRIQNALQSGNLLTIAGVFLVAGLLLSFTPCVLPMLPILSSIIVGQSQHGEAPLSRGKSFALSLAYSLGMALIYTALGVAAGLAGEGLAASLQNPWVLGTFGLLLVALSLSMFGAYNLQMPGFIQTRLSEQSSRLRGGTYVGAFLMGGLSALVVGPCVAAPLAGALVYISQTKNVVIGGVALFALASGMSVPLLLMGLSAGSLLPRAGMWMESVKTFFGMLLLTVAWWLVQPVLPASVSLGLLGVLLALGAAFLGGFDTLGATASVAHRAAKGLGLVLFIGAIAQIVGALTGADNPLQPLRPLVARMASAQAAPGASALPFQRITTPAELDAALAGAGGKPVMLDFYADWCVSCKEMEHSTFSDERVRQRLAGAVLVQADVTVSNEATKALLKRFGLFGPPGILFFDGQGRENGQARVIGYQAPEAFLSGLDAAGW
ncbi:protein-disulfide reductase DsbD [Aquabacterium sp.]|uniref:protein-disulfide reductase DsbD n=1 Tax=Aquabacterium sp. TaxID=1872578 RepID=UPI0035B1591D